MSPSSARHRNCDPEHWDIEVASPPAQPSLPHLRLCRSSSLSSRSVTRAPGEEAARLSTASRSRYAARVRRVGLPLDRRPRPPVPFPLPPPITLAPRRAPSRRIDMPLSRLSVPRPSSLALASASDDRNATGPPIPRYRSHDALPCPSADGLRLGTKVTPPVQAHPAGHRPFATRFRAAHLSRVAVGTHGLDRCTLLSLYPPMKNHITLTLFALFRAFSYHA